MVRNLPASAESAGDVGLIPGLGRSPRGGNGNPLQYPCLETSWKQWSLVGCSPWGHKELDMTEQLHRHTISKFGVASPDVSGGLLRGRCISLCLKNFGKSEVYT